MTQNCWDPSSRDAALQGLGLAAVIAAATKQMRAEWAAPRSLQSQYGRTIFIHNLKTARSSSLSHDPPLP